MTAPHEHHWVGPDNFSPVDYCGICSVPRPHQHHVHDKRRVTDCPECIGAATAFLSEGAAPRAEGLDGASKGIRCPATHDVAGWCSRDEGHPGAHESRHPSGPGLGAWWNERYPRSRPSDEREEADNG